MGHWKRKDWVAKLASVVCGLGLMGTAHAVVYVGQWDPVFNASDLRFGTTGTAFANLGWRGDISFDVTGCNPGGTGFAEVNVAATPDCSATMLSATVEFYNAALSGTPPTVASIAYSLAQLAYSDIEFLRYDDGVLTGLDYDSTAAVAALPGGALGSPAVFWQLGFDFPTPSFPTGYNGPNLRYCSQTTNYALPGQPPRIGCDESVFNGSNNVPAPITITLRDPGTVPTPGTLALVLAGLAVLVPLRRRRATASR